MIPFDAVMFVFLCFLFLRKRNDVCFPVIIYANVQVALHVRSFCLL